MRVADFRRVGEGMWVAGLVDWLSLFGSQFEVVDDIWFADLVQWVRLFGL